MPIKNHNRNHYIYRKAAISIHVIKSCIGNKNKVETLQN